MQLQYDLVKGKSTKMTEAYQFLASAEEYLKVCVTFTWYSANSNIFKHVFFSFYEIYV